MSNINTNSNKFNATHYLQVDLEVMTKQYNCYTDFNQLPEDCRDAFYEVHQGYQASLDNESSRIDLIVEVNKITHLWCEGFVPYDSKYQAIYFADFHNGIVYIYIEDDNRVHISMVRRGQERITSDIGFWLTHMSYRFMDMWLSVIIPELILAAFAPYTRVQMSQVVWNAHREYKKIMRALANKTTGAPDIQDIPVYSATQEGISGGIVHLTSMVETELATFHFVRGGKTYALRAILTQNCEDDHIWVDVDNWWAKAITAMHENVDSFLPLHYKEGALELVLRVAEQE